MGKSGKGLTSKGLSLAFFLLFLPPASIPCDEAMGYPLIRRLDSTDIGFRQYIDDVEINRRRLFTRPHESPAYFTELFTLYRYASGKNDTLFTLAARCNIPYSALASLNRRDNPGTLNEGSVILLPNCPGIFVPLKSHSDFEQLLASTRLSTREDKAVVLNIRMSQKNAAEIVYFFPGDDFNPTERIFFLNSGFRFPLRTFRLTSDFGIRQSPITGNIHHHQGIDMAAPLGTEVYAAADGIVADIGEDPVYGKYIIVKHGERWASLYGHLQKIETTLKSPVRSSTLIGRVGSTGLSTGPHLHFELRENGQAQDPTKYLFRPGK